MHSAKHLWPRVRTALRKAGTYLGRITSIKNQPRENAMYRRLLTAALLAAVFALPAAAGSVEEFHATFSGFNEVGGLGAGETGAILSEGKGHLTLKLDRTTQSVWFQLTYSGLSAP